MRGSTSRVRAAPHPGLGDGMTLRKGTDCHSCATAPAVGRGGGGNLRWQQRPFLSPKPHSCPYAAQMIESQPHLTTPPPSQPLSLSLSQPVVFGH